MTKKPWQRKYLYTYAFILSQTLEVNMDLLKHLKNLSSWAKKEVINTYQVTLMKIMLKNLLHS